MLEFQQLSFSYPDSTAPALVDISCAVTPGSYVVLLGANGSGKTTLARLANGLLLPESGAVIVDGLDSSDILRQRELRQLVGLVSQDPDEQIVSTTVLDEVAFGPENLGLPPVEIATRAQQSLAAVGLLGLSEHDPNTLSGGQKQRLVLAGILAMHPRYLVMDEPTAMLDSVAQNEFMNIIDDLRSQGRGILHITHDLTMAARANTVLVLCAGKLVFQGPPTELLAAEADLVAWQLKTSETDEHTLPHTIRRQSVATAVDGEPNAHINVEKTSPASTQLRLESVSFSYPSFQGPAVPVLKDLKLTIEPGSYTLVSGVNGAGKSTLLRLMAGLLEPNRGSITLSTMQSNSQSTTQSPSQSTIITPGQVGLVFQNPEDQLFAATVAEDIAFGPQNLGLLPKKGSNAHRNRSNASMNNLEGNRRVTDSDESDPRLISSSFDSSTFSQEDLVNWALQSVGLDSPGFAQRSPFTLSGGEMRRVAIAGILAMRPAFLLFDEPTAGLDAVGRAFVHRLILSELNRGTAVLVVSHSVEEFQEQADYQYRLDGGFLWPL